MIYSSGHKLIFPHWTQRDRNLYKVQLTKMQRDNWWLKIKHFQFVKRPTTFFDPLATSFFVPYYLISTLSVNIWYHLIKSNRKTASIKTYTQRLNFPDDILMEEICLECFIIFFLNALPSVPLQSVFHYASTSIQVHPKFSI